MCSVKQAKMKQLYVKSKYTSHYLSTELHGIQESKVDIIHLYIIILWNILVATTKLKLITRNCKINEETVNSTLLRILRKISTGLNVLPCINKDFASRYRNV